MVRKVGAVLFCLLILFMLLTCGSFGRQLALRNQDISKVQTSPYIIGQRQVPVNAQRVVALDLLVMEVPIALGVKLAGAPIKVLKWLGLEKNQEGVVDISNPPNFEKVLALKPDLILASKFFGLWTNKKGLRIFAN